MRREDLARALALQRGLSKAAARDQVDQLVHEILKSLRRGKPAEMPGVGTMVTRPAGKKGPSA